MQGPPETSRPAIYEFAPNVGAYTRTVANLAVLLESNQPKAFVEIREFLDATLASTRGGIEASPDLLRLLYSWSLLADIDTAGGSVWVRDSRIFVSWPQWDGGGGRQRASTALKAVGGMRPLQPAEIDRVKPLFVGDSDGEAVSLALAEGDFWLEPTESLHPSGIAYSEGFAAALRLWSMPYRGRQGRQKRFVLLGRHRVFGPNPVIAGLIEMGDEAPFCSWRDSLLSLDLESFTEWLNAQPSSPSAASEVSARLRAIRKTVLPTRVAKNISSQHAAELAKRAPILEDRAAGRSMVDDDFESRKRIAYAIRLARGELALEYLAKGGALSDEGVSRDLAAGVRAVHDLFLPRVHMEACVCGPVPPFSYGLGGKLAVAFLGHPSIVELSKGSRGTVLEQSFNLELLRPFLPNHGMLALTTKGLYARHSPMYNRAEIPGIDVPMRLRHVANTEGATTTFFGNRSAALARLVLEQSADRNRRQVSRLYGTGGAKRHRAIEVAASVIGLPGQLVSAGIRRPVYALSFAANSGDVIWRGASPSWSINRTESAQEYSSRAVDLWRSRWLYRAAARLSEFTFLPSPIRLFSLEDAPIE